GQDLVVVLDVLEDFVVGQKLHARAGGVGRPRDGQRGHTFAPAELHLVPLALAGNGQAQPLGQGVHAGHPHAVQTARDLVGVVVELPAGMQFGHDDFRGAAMEFVVFVDVGGDAPPVVADRNTVVGMNGHDDVVAIPGKRFGDGVVDDFEHDVVQAGAVG